MRKILILLLFTTGIYAQTASYYHDKYNNKKTASGIIFKQDSLYAAHYSLPFGTKVQITNLDNNKSVIVTIVDRGPYIIKSKKLYKHPSRYIDLSTSAFKMISTTKKGIIKIKYRII